MLFVSYKSDKQLVGADKKFSSLDWLRLKRPEPTDQVRNTTNRWNKYHCYKNSNRSMKKVFQTLLGGSVVLMNAKIWKMFAP